jgi:anhydro-N-acetylmuramic acid kinase
VVRVKSMVVAGVMSGTSADGVDVAVCRISPARVRGESPMVKLLGHVGVGYPKDVRAAVLGAMDADAISVAELARLNWRLGEVYADAVEKSAELARSEDWVGGVSWADGVSPGSGGEISW